MTKRITTADKIASLERRAEWWRDQAEQCRHVHEQAPDSPNGRRFVLYGEWADGCLEEAAELRGEPRAAKAPPPVTVTAVHLLGPRGKLLCGLPKSKVDQWCPAGMWPAVKPDLQCPVCAMEYTALACA